MRSILWSTASMALAALAMCSVLEWHRGTKPVTLYTQRLLVLASRTSSSTIEDSSPINDDAIRDETCRKYLVNFLNGTTDAKDECTGFYNAWKAADCQDDSHVSESTVAWYFILDIFGLGKRHRAENGTVVEDDVIIDDYYENWECCSSITDFYEKHCESPELDAFKLLGITMVFVVCGFMKSLIRVTGLHWIPDAGACILVGAIVGLLLRLFDPDVVKEKLSFDNDLFLQILLPPIILQAAIAIDKRAFRRDLFPILTLAIFGTGLSALAIGYITYHISSMGSGVGLPLLDSLLFGSLMSSIDPVATLSILSSVGVSQDDTIYTLIFGESLLNDGVAIVLFNSLVKHMGDAADLDVATLHETVLDFFTVSGGSIFIGICSGALCSFYFWSLQDRHTAVTEVAMFFTWAFIPYYIADGMGFSGIISIMVMGFMLDYYVIGGFQNEESDWMEYMELRVHPEEAHRVQPYLVRFKTICAKAFCGKGHMLDKSKQHVGFVAEVMTNLMETAIFAYLGLFLFNDKSFNVKMIGSGLISCVASRAGMVVALSLLINICVWIDLEGILGKALYMVRRSNARSNASFDDESQRSPEKAYLDMKTQMILFSAGVRGAVSYALVQNIPVYDAVTKHGSKFKNDLRAMTSSTIVVLLFTLGALTYFTVQRDVILSDRERSTNSLTHRLMSSGLDSDDGMDEHSSELNSSHISPSTQHNETTTRG